ncbi:unnamed protein product [Sphacelaria rigidula]
MFDLTVLSDSKPGNNLGNGKSMPLCVVMMAKAPVSFKSELQSLAVMAVIEAGMWAAAEAIKETVLCLNMTTDLGFEANFV